MRHGRRRIARLRMLAWLQGIFYVLTGVWPLVSMETFLAVKGPKVDLWLVRTVGILIAVINSYPVFTHTRSTSATLQAWAMQPRGK